ncbi:NAD(P)-dependent alcohol dehydrogenase [Rhodohalobacter sulfatireducens]|uniref:NAD(P)-dependent alcohol dehydrogenase n=1 Tax=Rhodohalobacter sulfatireducens TaxID=2911366 RepID=A0ABS9KGM4_9BACT|nr:NAD(P)-dependent alcohol dehydrogenase [Rhodohalobacter sulfatireducens]MCG2590004.1 NAD(P)-dependent alcohol dehydrogenase [Rhodohalobacter sulfatireducens]
MNKVTLNSMKVAEHPEYGKEEAIQFVDKEIPTPKNDELLIRIHASTVNRTDCAYLTGEPAIMRLVAGFKRPRNPVTGSDFAGTVVETGKDVSRFKKGDRVGGFGDNGVSSHAECMLIKEKGGVINIPDSLSFEKAAAAFEGAHYAYNFIKRMENLKGKKVLLNGATGAIGSAGLQFLKYHGAAVTAVCPSHQYELIKSLGADRVICFDKQDFTEDRVKYDFVFDAVGKSTFGRCKPLLTEHGVYISSELGPKAQNPVLALLGFFKNGKKVKFPVPYNITESLEYILARIQDGSFDPVIDRRYSFVDIKEAFQYVLTGDKIGNVVLNHDV